MFDWYRELLRFLKIKSDIYINVQGDEPLCDINDIKKLIKASKKYPNRIINGYTKIMDKKLFFSKKYS